MSIEGPGLYQDDTGHDVRAEAKELMGQGLSPAHVTAALEATWANVLGDEDVYCAFYLGLADTQCRLGRLDAEVGRIALDLIRSGRDLRRWEYSPALHSRRKAILTQLAARLVAPPSAERKVHVHRAFRTSLAVGDVFMHTSASGERFLFHVIGLSENGSDVHALLQILEWDWTQDPSEATVARARALKPAGHLANRIHLAPYRGTGLPKKQTRLLGNGKPQAPDPRPGIGGVVAWAGAYLDRIARSIVQSGDQQAQAGDG